MSPPLSARKLSDDDVRDVLLAHESVTNVTLADRFGVSTSSIWSVRNRRSPRALKIAHELGLLKPLTARFVWMRGTSLPVKIGGRAMARAR